MTILLFFAFAQNINTTHSNHNRSHCSNNNSNDTNNSSSKKILMVVVVKIIVVVIVVKVIVLIMIVVVVAINNLFNAHSASTPRHALSRGNSEAVHMQPVT